MLKSVVKFLKFSVLVGLVTLGSCKEDDPMEDDLPTPVVVPETYDFENVSFSGQTERLNMLDEMIAYMETANQEGVQLDVAVLRDMFQNTNGNGNGNFPFTSTKQLKDKCFELDQATMDEYFVKAVAASKSTEAGSNGVAGRVSSADGSKNRLFDENGWEYAEVVEKSMMGAVFYYQATSVYLGSDKMNVDNTEVVEGEGTAMQHHWDEAYGYFGATVDFPNNTEDLRYWAKYCNGRDAVLGTNVSLGTALRKGRQAITVKRTDVRDEAITEVRNEWERVCAGTAIHYLNASISNISDDYSRNHALSEAYAFINGLFYNEERTITEAEITEIKGLIGTNFYEVTTEGLTAARDKMATIFSMDDVKTSL